MDPIIASMVHMDGEWMHHWYILNDYGDLIAMSPQGFWSVQEAKADLEVTLKLLGLGNAA
jgi:hypothetical protein